MTSPVAHVVDRWPAGTHPRVRFDTAVARVTLNGKPVGPVGPKGQVREVQFTSGGFHIVAAPKPSLPLDNPI